MSVLRDFVESLDRVGKNYPFLVSMDPEEPSCIAMSEYLTEYFLGILIAMRKELTLVKINMKPKGFFGAILLAIGIVGVIIGVILIIPYLIYRLIRFAKNPRLHLSKLWQKLTAAWQWLCWGS